MSTSTSFGAGSVFSIGAATGTSGETFTAIGSILSVSVTPPSISYEDTTTLSSAVVSGIVVKEQKPSSFHPGKIDLTCTYVPSDAGQNLLNTAFQSASAWDFKITPQTGTAHTFTAYVSTMPIFDGISGADKKLTCKVSLDIVGLMTIA